MGHVTCLQEGPQPSIEVSRTRTRDFTRKCTGSNGYRPTGRCTCKKAAESRCSIRHGCSYDETGGQRASCSTWHVQIGGNV
eukprot:2209804-Rhodomonas_salina.1